MVGCNAGFPTTVKFSFKKNVNHLGKRQPIHKIKMLTTLVNMHNLYTVNTYSIFKAINSKVSIQDDNAESINIVLLLRQKVHHVKTSNIITKQFSSKRTECLV